MKNSHPDWKGHWLLSPKGVALVWYGLGSRAPPQVPEPHRGWLRRHPVTRQGLWGSLPRRHGPSFRSSDIALEMKSARARKGPRILRQDFICNSTNRCPSKSKKMGWDYLWTESNKSTPWDNGADTSDFPYLLCACLFPGAPQHGLMAFQLVHISLNLNPDLLSAAYVSLFFTLLVKTFT